MSTDWIDVLIAPQRVLPFFSAFSGDPPLFPAPLSLFVHGIDRLDRTLTSFVSSARFTPALRPGVLLLRLALPPLLLWSLPTRGCRCFTPMALCGLAIWRLAIR